MEALYLAAWIIIPAVVGVLATAKLVAQDDIKKVEKARTTRSFDRHCDQALAIANHN